MEDLFSSQMAKSLVEQISEALANAIIDGHLKPGEPLIEQVLQKQFGVSRTPIRETFRILEEKGLIVVVPRKGAYVKEITKRDIEETFPVRAILEGYAAAISIDEINESQLDEMARCIEVMEKSASANNFVIFRKSHYEFHRVFIKASRNELLINLLENLLRKALWFRFSFLYFHENYQFSIEKHKEILRLFRGRDPVKVESAVKGHIEMGKESFLKYLNEVHMD
jgi:DNA-binding GntR family transcriptional regulator